jgi:hypothetical protein
MQVITAGHVYTFVQGTFTPIVMISYLGQLGRMGGLYSTQRSKIDEVLGNLDDCDP